MSIDVRQLHPRFVGEVSGVDLGRPIDDATLAVVQAAIARHAVLVFHDQAPSDERQIAFAERFGPLG